MLAQQYDELSKDIPLILSGLSVIESDLKRRRIIHKVLIGLNFIFPTARAVVYFVYLNQFRAEL